MPQKTKEMERKRKSVAVATYSTPEKTKENCVSGNDPWSCSRGCRQIPYFMTIVGGLLSAALFLRPFSALRHSSHFFLAGNHSVPSITA